MGNERTGMDLLAALPAPWTLAFEEAWRSFASGSFGIGAVLIDPTDGSVVSVGRNRVAEHGKEPGLLSGNMTAHAEMNAFAALDRFNAEGLHVYTTLEPCLMCSATAMMLKVEHVHLAADDEFYEGLGGLWPGHHLTRERQPERTGPFTGGFARLAQFARLLPMSFTVERLPGRTADQLARLRHPELAVVIDGLIAEGAMQEVRSLSTLAEGLAALWPRLSD